MLHYQKCRRRWSCRKSETKKSLSHTENKEQNDRGNSFYMSNYITCKQIKLSSPKTGRMMHMMELFAIYKRLTLVHGNSNQKRLVVAVLISDKID